jgi:hypothetical protein
VQREVAVPRREDSLPSPGKSYRALLSEPNLGVVLGEWLQRLAADHDGTALLVAKTIGSLMIEDGPDMWFKLSRISYLTGPAPEIITGILYPRSPAVRATR